MLLVVIIIGESVPDFGQIMDLVGGTAVAMLTFILPPIFYLKLRTPDPENDKRYVK